MTVPGLIEGKNHLSLSLTSFIVDRVKQNVTRVLEMNFMQELETNEFIVCFHYSRKIHICRI